LCGDATSADDVARLLAGHVPDMAWCDPPYGVNAVKGGHIGGAKPFGKKRRGGGHSGKTIIPAGSYFPIIGDDSTDTAISAAEICAGVGARITILWGANNYAEALPPSRCWLVWDKQSTGNVAEAELAWTSMDAPIRLFKHQWSGLMKASERGERRVHPTQKPVALALWCFAEFGKSGDVVIDLFLGSAPSLIAAERSGRMLLGMELAPEYIDVAILRWQGETGKQAVLDGTGEKFDDLCDVRAADRVAAHAG
jgi:hypothetical protein